MGLWFRTGTWISALVTMIVGSLVFVGVFLMCASPSNGHAMNTDPYYNGSLAFYSSILLGQLFMMGVTGFGMYVTFKVWRNNHQLDHKLRHLYSIWLMMLCLASFMVFILGILGLVRYKEPQEEIMTLFEIFSKYNQDVKFVGSFERYQRENSCCGINGPDDWMMAQFKGGGGGSGGGMGGMGGAGGMDSYMGSPSTGKCHLTPPTIPMGCGKKLLEDIHWTMTCYCAILVLETLSGLANVAMAWISFFYWIEKEVIIIPEDEVSNLIVIEPESSTSGSVYTEVTDSEPVSGWETSHYSSLNGSEFSGTHYSGSRAGSHSRTHYSRITGASHHPSRNPYAEYSQGMGGSAAVGSGFYPNMPRPPTPSRFTKISNVNGTLPSIGGPHSAYLSMSFDPNDENRNVPVPHSISEAAHGRSLPPRDDIVLHQGQAKSVKYPVEGRPPSGYPGTGTQYQRSRVPPGTLAGTSYMTGRTGQTATRGTLRTATAYLERESSYHPPKRTKRVKKEHSEMHMLHKQERALGGRVLAEMHVDHSRDSEPMLGNMSASKVHGHHRQHHATLALIKNKKPPKPKELFAGPEKGHGQTGHLANDILAMSGGAGGAKSMIDDINLPVEHDQSLEKTSYLKKLRNEKKHKHHGMMDHPDKDHPGHGPVDMESGVLEAPSADGSQVQDLLDNVMNVAGVPQPPKEDSKEIVKVHEVDEKHEKMKRKKEKELGHHHEHHEHEHHHHGSRISHGTIRSRRSGSIRSHYHHDEDRSLRSERSDRSRRSGGSYRSHEHHHPHHHHEGPSTLYNHSRHSGHSHHPEHHHNHHEHQHSLSHHHEELHHHQNHSAAHHEHAHHQHPHHHHHHHDGEQNFGGSAFVGSGFAGSAFAGSSYGGSGYGAQPTNLGGSGYVPPPPGNLGGSGYYPGTGSIAGSSNIPQTEVLYKNNRQVE